MSLLKNLLISTPSISFPYDAFRKSHDIVGSTTVRAGLYKSESNPIWSTGDYAWSTKTPANSVILRSPTTGEPVQYDGKYWMAYDAVLGEVGDGIGLATSADLINWTNEAGNPIIAPDDVEAEDWEKVNPCPNDFLYMGDEVGHAYDFWIFYRAMDAGITHTAVGVIKSNDMVTWVRDLAHNPIVDWNPAWVADSRGIEDFRVQKMSTGSWMAIYEADRAPALGPNIGAASCDQTLPDTGWTEEGRVCSTDFDGRFIANPTVLRNTINGNEYYYCYYEYGYNVGDKSNIYGMYALEADIFTEDAWTQMPNPVVQGAAGWENFSIIPNGLIFYGGIFYIYYTGNLGASKQIGLATGSPPGVVDYQITITVHYGAGADSDDDVYLDGKCRTDFEDIRFMDSVGIELSYWIQKKVDSDYAIFWVKVPWIPTSPNTATIYIYYGKADAMTTESGVDTWIDYEDWESYNVDDVLPLGDFEATAIQEICKVSNNRAYKGSKSLYCDDDSATNRNEMNWNFADKITNGFRFFIAFYKDTDYATVAPIAFLWYNLADARCITLDEDGDGNIRDYYAGEWHDIGADLTEDDWHIYEICAELNADTWDFRFDDTWYLNRTKRDAITGFNFVKFYLAGIAGKFEGNLGICAIGNYIDPEPTHDTWGSEEAIVWPF